MAFPDVVVEIAFASDPGDASPVWTDVSADFMSIETTRGRNQELNRYQAGTCSVVLKDTARKYDPTNAASPYSPNLLPMKRLRVTATWAAVVYPIFSGFIDSFDHEYEGTPNGMARATVRATDGFKVLAAANLESSAYAQEVADAGPVAWWRLGEANATGQAFDSVGSYDLNRTGTMTFGQPGLVSREADTAVSIVDLGETNPENGLDYLGPTLLSGSPLSIELLFKCSANPGATRNIFAMVSQDLTLGLQIYTQSSTYKVAAAAPGGGLIVTSTTPVAVGDTVHLVVTWTSGGLLTLYVDGVAEIFGAAGAVTLPSTVYTSIGGATLTLNQVSPADGIYDEVAIYDYALTAGQVAAHAEAVATPWSGDTPKERIDRVLDSIGWPAGLRDLDTGSSTLQPVNLATTALDHVQKAADSDFGRLFMSASGEVRFIGREGLWNLPNLATFGDDPTDATEHGYRAIRPEYTDALIRNDVTVSRVEGVAQRATDPTSIASFLLHSYSLDGLIHDSDTLSRAAAEFLVSEYKDPRRRISGLDVAPRGNPNQPGSTDADLFPLVLGAELTDQLTVIDRPPGGGAANEQDSAIEGITHRIFPLWWETSWRLAPSFGSGVPDYEVGVWDETNWDESRWAF